MSALDITQRYFDAWNRRDPVAVLQTLHADGSYTDPTTGGPLRGDAFLGYMNGLFSAFPDTSFEVASEGLAAPELVAAQWIMRGTNTGSMFGLPPTGKSIVLNGADFIRVEGGKIRSVEGYFDSRVIPDQLGLQVVVQPTAIGPFTFGTSARVWGGKTEKPGAFGITALHARGPDDVNGVREQTRLTATEMLSMKGFIGLVTAIVGNRMLTISAWESADDPRQLIQGGQHSEAMKKFFGTELGAGGYTAVLVPERINTMWVRCASCQKMTDHAAENGMCTCGATLPQPIPYW